MSRRTQRQAKWRRLEALVWLACSACSSVLGEPFDGLHVRKSAQDAGSTASSVQGNDPSDAGLRVERDGGSNTTVVEADPGARAADAGPPSTDMDSGIDRHPSGSAADSPPVSDAGMTCECSISEPAVPRRVDCEVCGTKQEVRVCDAECRWTPWRLFSLDCAAPEERCTPGRPEEMLVDCGGSCGQRVAAVRTCDGSTCRWTDWAQAKGCAECPTPVSECAISNPQCVGGNIESSQEACTTCGVRTRTRSCNPATCTWSAWTPASACTFCDECSEVQWCNAPSGTSPVGVGTLCRQTACDKDQARGDCLKDIPRVCVAATQPVYIRYLDDTYEQLK
jgi:hypothetical protein